jgi:DNA-binding NarL/FixJ family response regulator
MERELRLHEAVEQLVGRGPLAERGPPPKPRPEGIQLSRREIEIISLVARGSTNQEIGRQLRLSPGTVRNYNGRIFRKLGVASRTEAAVRALEWGLVNPSTTEQPPSPATEAMSRAREAG